MVNDRKYVQLMKQNHNFVDRNALLFRAIYLCESGREGFTSADAERLTEMGLRRCCLDNVPAWLRKWASLICQYIAYE